MRPTYEDSLFFWNTAREFIDHILPDIRKASIHTVAAYRQALNSYIDYLEGIKSMRRKDISFKDFSIRNLMDFMGHLSNSMGLKSRTCNLRITAIHAFLEYASSIDNSLTSCYLSSKKVRLMRAENHPIEFFETAQMKAILAACGQNSRMARRNQTMLALLYDTGARVSELTGLCLKNLRLDAEIPYAQLFGKGSLYRNVPIMGRTASLLKRYLKEFHPVRIDDAPLFYISRYGAPHRISEDMVSVILKKAVEKARSNGVDMPDHVYCHMVRKSRAMHLYQSGMSLPHIQQLLGHKNISTTTGFYAFATMETIADAMEKADGGNARGSGIKKWKDKDLIRQILRL